MLGRYLEVAASELIDTSSPSSLDLRSPTGYVMRWVVWTSVVEGTAQAFSPSPQLLSRAPQSAGRRRSPTRVSGNITPRLLVGSCGLIWRYMGYHPFQFHPLTSTEILSELSAQRRTREAIVARSSVFRFLTLETRILSDGVAYISKDLPPGFFYSHGPWASEREVDHIERCISVTATENHWKSSWTRYTPCTAVQV